MEQLQTFSATLIDGKASCLYSATITITPADSALLSAAKLDIRHRRTDCRIASRGARLLVHSPQALLQPTTLSLQLSKADDVRLMSLGQGHLSLFFVHRKRKTQAREACTELRTLVCSHRHDL